MARARQESRDLGGYLDLLGDTVVYAPIPLRVAAASGDEAVWAATGVMLATFYVNAVSWLFLAAVLENRRAGAVTALQRVRWAHVTSANADFRTGDISCAEVGANYLPR